VALAARGARNMDTGEERIVDDDDKATLRLQARAVYIEATIIAALLTGASQLLFG
jgi:hypothetical protein